VNVFDLAILGNYYGVPGDMDWKHADFNDDDTVDVFDLALLGNNYQPGGGSPIPEPTLLALLALGVLASARRGRRTSL